MNTQPNPKASAILWSIVTLMWATSCVLDKLPSHHPAPHVFMIHLVTTGAFAALAFSKFRDLRKSRTTEVQ